MRVVAALSVPLVIYAAYKWNQRKKNALEDDENCKTGGRENDSHDNQQQAERKLKEKDEELKEKDEELKEMTERMKEKDEELKETTERMKEMTRKYDKQQEEIFQDRTKKIENNQPLEDGNNKLTGHTLVIDELKKTQQHLESKMLEIRDLQKELQRVEFQCEFVTDKKQQLETQLTELKDQNKQELRIKIQDEQLKRKEVEEEMEALKKELETMKKKLKEIQAEAEVVPELEIPGEHLLVPTEQKET